MKLKDKFAVVTGASTGIGKAIAIEFAKEGSFIALVARTKDRLKKTKELVEKVGGKAEVFVADLTKVDSINRFISNIKKRTKRVDILVNVAGIWHGKNESYVEKDFETFSQKIILDTYWVGVVAPTLLVHGLISLIPEEGKILNISGTFPEGAKGMLPYYVSKRAIEDLTVGLSEELATKKIQVNCISPEYVSTEAYKMLYPQYLDLCISPEKIAKYAVYLCSKEANKITGEVFVMKKGRKPYEGYHT